MRKLIIILIIIGSLIGTYEIFKPKRYGAVLRHEDFRGTRVPIIADGRGGKVRVVTDVPWDKFTAREKMRMAANGGGWLSLKDLAEIWVDCGEWRTWDQFKDIKIELIKPGE